MPGIEPKVSYIQVFYLGNLFKLTMLTFTQRLTPVYMPTCLGVHMHIDWHETCAVFSLRQPFQGRYTRWDWVCYMAEQPPHQKVIIIESIMWCSPGEGMAPHPARWAVEECILLRSREQTWAGSCQAVEPREQMAAAQPFPRPTPWLGESVRGEAWNLGLPLLPPPGHLTLYYLNRHRVTDLVSRQQSCPG